MTAGNTTGEQGESGMDRDKHTGGYQDVLHALPAELRVILQSASRVVLVANNPAISAADFQALTIGADDVVVSFNRCIKSALLTPEAVNVFVHGFNGSDRYFFGLPDGPEIQRLAQRSPSRCFTILVGCTGEMSPLPKVAMYWDRIPLPALWNYPTDRPNGKRYVGPSTGFNTLVLFDWLRSHAGYRYQLVTLGFSNEAGKLWGGHAWDYERNWLQDADVLVVALPPKRWWKSLFSRS
jgi:hypothetical protein